MPLWGELWAPCANNLFPDSLGVPAPKTPPEALLALDDGKLLSGFRRCIRGSRRIHRRVLPSLYLDFWVQVDFEPLFCC